MPQRERNPAYIHTLTTEFASTLDQIPQDMARQFADLRELDAVLSSSLQQITQRINDLTERIEATVQPGVQHNPTQLFRALTEIADETGRIKLGGEDKIRVASLAADNLNAYYHHLEELVRQMYPLDEAFMLSVLAPQTAYPHVSPTAMLELSDANRRPTRRAHANGHAGGAGTSARGTGVIESPLKRKRPVTRDDTDESTPRRGPAALDAEAYRPGGGNRPRAPARKQRADATPVASPAASVQPLPSFRGPNSSVGPPHFANRPMVHSPLMNASLPPIHARKPPVAPALGRVQQPEPSAHPSPGSLLFQTEPQHPLIPMPSYSGNPYPQPVLQTPILTAPQYTPVGASTPGEMVPTHPSLGHPSLPPVSGSSAHPSLHQPNPPFDDRAIPPPQGVHHLNIRVAPGMPTKAEAIATPPIREVIMHSNPSTPPPPAHHHHHPSLPPNLNPSHPHSLMIVPKDSSPANASATTNIIDPDDDKLYCFCGNHNFGEMIGCDGPECETEWFHFACVGIDPRAKPEGSWFCEHCRLGKDSSVGKKVGGGSAKGGASNRGGGRGKKSAGGGARRGGRV